MDALCLNSGIHRLTSAIAMNGGGGGEARGSASQVSASSSSSSPSRFSFRYPLRSLWPNNANRGEESKSSSNRRRQNGIALEDDAVLVDNNGEGSERVEAMVGSDERDGNWVLKVLHLRSLWNGEEAKIGVEEEDNVGGDKKEEKEESEEECDVCIVDDDDDDDGEGKSGFEFNRDSFSRLLRRVPLAEARLYAQMSYLGNLAYSIPRIREGNILKYRGLLYVTSSIEKRELATKAEKGHVSTEHKDTQKNMSKAEKGQVLIRDEESQKSVTNKNTEVKGEKINGNNRVNASAAYQVAASAVSYIHSQTKNILPFTSSKPKNDKDEDSPESREDGKLMNSEVASFMANPESVTAVVAAKEEVKQAVADDLNSTCSSPCEWFACDDDHGTRYFVIQGSETFASWQANLLFEPAQFEGMDVIIHRGIYEAAKGMYEQMLPEVRAHLRSYGKGASLRFTGHSLGGSLSLVINLMLLIRGEAPASSLLPVITFGAPSIMCGGDCLLQKLGLPKSHVQSITMHRDIVPRAFSCNYPNHVAEILKAINGKFRNHPCLNNQKILYGPVGELVILQPDEKFSPQHDLLPSGGGLYFLSCSLSDTNSAEKLIHAAQLAFLNSPHPLEILSDPAAFGTGGTVQRDHDMNSYVKSVRGVIRQELNHIRKFRREKRRKFWWSIHIPSGGNGSVVERRHLASNNGGHGHFNFAGALRTGRQSLRRFSRLVASQHTHLLVVFLLPARLLLLGTFSTMSFH